MKSHLGVRDHRSANAGVRRAALAIAVMAVVVAVRQLVDLVLRSAAPMWSTGAMLFVETLALAGVYGAVAWFFVVVPARRRPASPDSVSHLRIASPGNAAVPTAARVPINRPRHLTLVR